MTSTNYTRSERYMTDYSSYQHLLIEKADGIITLTMNRPESLNSANFRLASSASGWAASCSTTPAPMTSSGGPAPAWASSPPYSTGPSTNAPSRDRSRQRRPGPSRLCQNSAWVRNGAEAPYRHSRESGNPGVLEGRYSGVSPLHPSWIPAFAVMTIRGSLPRSDGVLPQPARTLSE